MSDKRQMWQTITELLQRVEHGEGVPKSEPAQPNEAIQQEIRKLGKAQMKANLLAEQQTEAWQALVAELEAVRVQQTTAVAELVAEKTAAKQHALLLSLMPVLDSVENALRSGMRFLHDHPHTAEGEALRGWLAGLRLVHDHLLGVLAVQGVTPIPALGEPFDPNRHTAVGMLPAQNGRRPNSIATEKRKGYQDETGVLRYAEVVVYK